MFDRCDFFVEQFVSQWKLRFKIVGVQNALSKFKIHFFKTFFRSIFKIPQRGTNAGFYIFRRSQDLTIDTKINLKNSLSLDFF